MCICILVSSTVQSLAELVETFPLGMAPAKRKSSGRAGGSEAKAACGGNLKRLCSTDDLAKYPHVTALTAWYLVKQNQSWWLEMICSLFAEFVQGSTF